MTDTNHQGEDTITEVVDLLRTKMEEMKNKMPSEDLTENKVSFIYLYLNLHFIYFLHLVGKNHSINKRLL